MIGGGNSALDASLQLKQIAERIFLITDEDRLAGDEIRRNQVLAAEKIEVYTSAQITAIRGDRFVKAIDFTDERGQESKEVAGVFIEIGSIPSTAFLPSEIALNELGEIVIDSNNRTSLPGVFAAGDVSNVVEKQIIIAAGEGAKAALSAYAWLIDSGYMTAS